MSVAVQTPPEALASMVDDERITAVGLFQEARAALAYHLGRALEEEAGLPAAWYEVLVRLGRSPDFRMRMSDLAAAVSLTTSGTTRLVDRIEAAGLIRRENCAFDRRVLYASLTDKGREVLLAATPAHLSSIDRHLVSVLTPEELRAFTAALRKVRDANWRGAGSPAAIDAAG